MENINKTQLANEVKLFLKELDVKQPKQESLEWYLKNNLISYLEDVEKANTASDLKIATKIFSRFCIESMDWDTSLFKQCTKITELGLKIAKNS